MPRIKWSVSVSEPRDVLNPMLFLRVSYIKTHMIRIKTLFNSL